MTDRTVTSFRDVLQPEMRIDEDEVSGRKRVLEFGAEDVELLESLRDTAALYADPVIDDFYRHILSFDDTRAFLRDPRTLERVKRLQKEYFLQLTLGDYGPDYIANRLRIGAVHERIELAPKWYLGMYSFYLRQVARRLQEEFAAEPTKAWAAFLSLMKLVFMDIGLAVDTYIYAREATLRKQQEAIHELSTPVLQLREGLLLLPLIGVIDTHRARLITDSVLRSIRGTRARVVVMDITGASTIDSKVANHL